MMKLKLGVFSFFILFISIPVCFGALADVPQTVDGELTEGEYAHSYVTLEGSEELFVKGGGAERITAANKSYVEVQYTSTPLSNNSGIFDIVLHDESKLLYLGGVTQEITLYKQSTALLKGGNISSITILHGPNDSCYVTIFCQEGYTKTNSGISGLWADGTSFNIGFNDVSPYTTAPYVSVEIVPEPATLAFFALGGLLIRKRK